MHSVFIGLIGVGAMIVGLAISVPIAAACGMVSIIGIAAIAGWKVALGMVAVVSFNEATSYDLAAMVLFLAIGVMVNESGMADYLFDAFSKWFSRVRGGLMIATITSAAFFGACSGSTIASCALFGKLAVPRMVQRGYDPALASGCVAASGTLAALIPPSGLLILYGILTETSIGHLFIAGLVPGLINALLYFSVVYGISITKPGLVPPSAKFNWAERLSSARKAWPIPLIGVFIIMALYLGIATPTEIAGLGAFFCMVVTIAYTGVRGARLPQAMLETARQGAMVLLIVIGAMMFGRFLALAGVAPWLLSVIEGFGLPKYGVLLLLVIMYLILGSIVSTLAMIVVTIPIVFPLVISLGFDPIWFGVVLVQLAEIAVLTPPMGINVFVTKGVIGDMATLPEVIKGTMIFALGDFGILALLLLFPEIALFLPRTM